MKKEKAMRKYFMRVLTLVWMLVIFTFSAKPAEVSTRDSLFVGRKIGQLMIADFEEWNEEKQIAFAKKIQYPVRKGAHMTEYTVLGILILYSWDFNRHSFKKISWCSWSLGTLYAASDEFHQLFVEGRSGQWTDVMIDSIGVVMGVLFIGIICKKRRRSYVIAESQ